MGILDVLILLPILAAAMIGLGAPARLTAVVAAAFNFVVSIHLFFWAREQAVDAAGYFFRSSASVADNPDISWALGVDGMALVMVLLTTLVTLSAVWFTRPETSHPRLLYSSVLLIAAGALGAFLSTDIFFFYAFHELALVPTFLAIGLAGQGDRKAAAWKITIYLGVGSMVLLLGLLGLVLFGAGGAGVTFDMIELASRGAVAAADTAVQQWIFVGLFVGFGILVSLFPFHSWAAPAYAAAPTPVAMMHAGVLKKFGLYGLLRLAVPLLPGAAQGWAMDLLLLLLLGNIIWVGLITLSERSLDAMLANSSVMHMGYIFLGIATYNAIGNGGAVLLIFAHGLSIALLFGLCGKLRDDFGTLRFDRLGGLAAGAPGFACAFGLGAFASIGLPGFANFAGEIMVFLGSFKGFGGEIGRLQIVAIIAAWGVVLSAVYMLRAYRAIFQGEKSSEVGSGRSVSRGWLMPSLILLAGLLVIGFMPNLFLELLPQHDAQHAVPAAEVAPAAAADAHTGHGHGEHGDIH
jgi:NADH-quinone oxidoreductase subunit M